MRKFPSFQEDENSPGCPYSGIYGVGGVSNQATQSKWKIPVSHKVMRVSHKPGCRPRHHIGAWVALDVF